jgi:hypothetical protein
MTGVSIGAPVLFCAAKYFRYDVVLPCLPFSFTPAVR